MRSPALAFFILSSVFKEPLALSARASRRRWWCRWLGSRPPAEPVTGMSLAAASQGGVPSYRPPEEVSTHFRAFGAVFGLFSPSERQPAATSA
jgi:hypothetical protein